MYVGGSGAVDLGIKTVIQSLVRRQPSTSYSRAATAWSVFRV